MKGHLENLCKWKIEACRAVNPQCRLAGCKYQCNGYDKECKLYFPIRTPRNRSITGLESFEYVEVVKDGS